MNVSAVMFFFLSLSLENLCSGCLAVDLGAGTKLSWWF